MNRQATLLEGEPRDLAAALAAGGNGAEDLRLAMINICDRIQRIEQAIAMLRTASAQRRAR